MSVADQSPPQSALSHASPAVIRLSREFVTRISGVIRRIDASECDSRTGITGLLLGRAEHDTVIVEAFKPFAFHDSKNGHLLPSHYLDAALERLLAPSKADAEPSSPRVLIGWFCIRAAGPDGLLDSDIALHNRNFLRPTDVALVLRPQEQGSVSAQLYTRSRDGVISREEYCHGSVSLGSATAATGPVDVMMPEVKPPEGTERAYQALGYLNLSDQTEKQLAAREVGVRRLARADVLSPVSKPSLFKRNQRSWISAVAIFAISGGCTFAWMYMHATSLRPSITRPVLPLSVPTTDLGMKVEPQGDRLLVTWNRESPAVHSANFGMLFVDDGQQHHEIVLAPGEVATGSVLYTPAASEVAFRLELLEKQGSSITQSVRVLDGSRSASPLAGSDSKPEAAPEFAIPPNSAPNQHQPIVETARDEHKPASPPPQPAPPRAIPDLASNKMPEPKQASAKPLSSISAPEPPVEHPKSASDKPSHSTPLPSSPEVQSLTRTNLPPPPHEIETVQASSQVAPIDPLLNLSLPKPSPKSAAPEPSKSSDMKLAWNDALPTPVKEVLPNLKILGPSPADGVTPIKVSIRVDEHGRVTSVRAVGKDAKRNNLLATEAVNAASQWTFEPKKSHGKSVACDFIMVFRFNNAPHSGQSREHF